LTNNKVYCSKWSDSVTVIDGVTDSVIATVATGWCSDALCYNPTNNRVYCANTSSNSVTVVDGATDSVLVTVAPGDQPCALCYDLTFNKIYCANNGSTDVTVIDGATNDVVTTIEVGAKPIAFACSPAQNRVYVANHDGSSISVLRDSSSFVGMEESFKPQAPSRKPMPTIIRGVLFLPRAENGDSPSERSARGTVPIFRAALLDVSGRNVMNLLPGVNDVSKLSPGVYFVREAQAQAPAQAVRKVVITR
jgi:YVTN family beta-propeller protein